MLPPSFISPQHKTQGTVPSDVRLDHPTSMNVTEIHTHPETCIQVRLINKVIPHCVQLAIRIIHTYVYMTKLFQTWGAVLRID